MEISQSQYGRGDASFQAAGGEEGIRKLVDTFSMTICAITPIIREFGPGTLTLEIKKSREISLRDFCVPGQEAPSAIKKNTAELAFRRFMRT
jgi:hypothetical protein